MDTTLLSQTEGVNQGFGAVIVYQGERTILSYYSPKEPPFPEESCGAEWYYLTSVGEKFEEYYEKVYTEIEHCNPKLVFNPGGRQIAKGIDWLKKYLEKTHLIIVNRQEAEKIVGMEKTHNKEKELLDALSSFGPDLVVVTDGGNGTYAKEDGKYYHLGVLPVDAIERTGAGDAFSAGCVATLVQGKSLGEAMVVGMVNATSVIGYVGPETGLLKADQLPEWLERVESNGIKLEEI
jgi:sugar/nucleoside kinase (ribokinase family)